MKAFCGVRKPIFVRQTASEGTPIKRITHITGLSHQLVRQILRGEREGVLSIRQSSLDHWLLWIECEWTGGGHNAAELWRRFRTAGFGGTCASLVSGDPTATSRRRDRLDHKQMPANTQNCTKDDDGKRSLSNTDAVTVARIETAILDLAVSRDLIHRFVTRIRNHDAAALAPWLAATANSDLVTFVRGATNR